MSLKFGLDPQAAKGTVTQYDAHERKRKKNYSEKLEETKNNSSTQIRKKPHPHLEACIMRPLCEVILITRHYSGITFSVWQVGERRPS